MAEFKCTSCGMVHTGSAPDKCGRCGGTGFIYLGNSFSGSTSVDGADTDEEPQQEQWDRTMEVFMSLGANTQNPKKKGGRKR